jgi:putative transposase
VLVQKGTAVKKPAKEETPGQASMWTQLLMPLAAMVRGDLLSLVHQLGMQAVALMLEAERTQLCGERYKHDASRRATRGGSTRGELALGGRRVTLQRPRVVDRQKCELPLETWTALASRDPLDLRALEQMTIGVATRKYARSLETLHEQIEARGTSKSAVSRRFVALTAEKLQEWMARPLGDLDLWAVFIDGIHFGEHVVLCALGIDATGAKHALGLWEGATENAEACTSMLANLVDRGLRPNRTRLFVIDGSKALRAGIRTTFGKRALVQRCQVHKVRNVLGHLPEARHGHVRSAMRAAYKCTDVAEAKRQLNALARSLQKKHPSAAASLQEGLDETLTVMGLGLGAALTRTLSTTNPIEHMNERIRTTARRVKRWDDGQMVLRWVLVGVLEAARGFRRLKGHRDMRALVARLTLLDAPAPHPEAVDAKSSAA